MNSKPNETSPSSSLGGTDQEIMQTLHRHQRRLKWLIAVAVAFWSLAVIASVGVLLSYSLLYAPKEKQIMNDYGTLGRLRDSGERVPPGEPAQARAPTTEEKALGLHFTMNYIVTKGILIVAASVLILSGGTLATLLLVIFNRRVTLRQINHSLAQISRQLKEHQTAQGS